jgi:hypothetical protein
MTGGALLDRSLDEASAPDSCGESRLRATSVTQKSDSKTQTIAGIPGYGKVHLKSEIRERQMPNASPFNFAVAVPKGNRVASGLISGSSVHAHNACLHGAEKFSSVI